MRSNVGRIFVMTTSDDLQLQKTPRAMPALDPRALQACAAQDSAEVVECFDCITQISTPGLSSKRETIKYLCNLFRLSEWIANPKKTASSKLCVIQGRSLSPEDTKIKWRRDQIRNQIQQASVVNSSWRNNQLRVIWCGHMRKWGAAFLKPQERWFEVRQEPAPQGSAMSHIVVMQYQSASALQTVKRLVVSDPRREAARDIMGKAYISVAVEGRRGRLMLSLAWDHEADVLVWRMASALRAALRSL